jgi:hypothetical protein
MITMIDRGLWRRQSQVDQEHVCLPGTAARRLIGYPSRAELSITVARRNVAQQKLFRSTDDFEYHLHPLRNGHHRS